MNTWLKSNTSTLKSWGQVIQGILSNINRYTNNKYFRSNIGSDTHGTVDLSKDEHKLLRDHDNMLKNLRQDVNHLRDKTESQDKNHSLLQKDHEAYKTSNNDIISKRKLYLKPL